MYRLKARRLNDGDWVPILAQPEICREYSQLVFVVFMELIGTIVLPIAITLTYSLVINSFLHPPKNFSDAIPLIILAAILGLPAVLILPTSREVSYVFWMLIYLLALPVWNFVLPLYALWHFQPPPLS
ncbi:chitin synthase [Puccinia triticina 1-1 BBBD Race 1]|uniref:Chitin synthase n=1 Tax=Puccinia triticina (isolate 1-1 / race 1 (BBBD)) TaxID=630390 RepID=A0A0C4ESX3_PUCT1|nr:chitin synthase [Puccinia triticina 1-1 BBBD Race 1]